MSEPLRLAYLTSLFARPSDTFIRSEVDRLRAKGIEVDTFSIRRPAVAPDSDPNVLQHQHNTSYILEKGPLILLEAALRTLLKRPTLFFEALSLAWKTRTRGLKGFLLQLAYFTEACYLAKELRRREIRHLHNHIGENSATVAMLASCLAEIPYSLSIHGPGIFTAAERWALGTKLDRAQFTACISSFCRSQCMMYARPVTWPRLHVVRCAVGADFLDPPPRAHAFDQPPLIVCVGRLCVEKGQRLLIEAAAALRDEGHSFRLLFIGDGPERIGLEDLIDVLQLNGMVEIIGWQPTQRIKELLLEAKVMVLPSFAEGLPIVIMEALALDCPVISTSIAAISELVIPGENGWLLPPGETQPLVNALREAIQLSVEESAALGQKGRKRVLEMHHPDRQTEELLALFQSAKRVRTSANR